MGNLKDTTARQPKLTRCLEDYLEAVFMLVRRRGVARVRDIAAITNVGKSSVTAALRQLAAKGLVHYEPYELVTLTPRGEGRARNIRGRHDDLAEFLLNVLNVDPQGAQENACRMEHVIDEQVLRRLRMLAEFLQERGGSQDWLEQFRAHCRRRESDSEPAAPPQAQDCRQTRP